MIGETSAELYLELQLNNCPICETTFINREIENDKKRSIGKRVSRKRRKRDLYSLKRYRLLSSDWRVTRYKIPNVRIPHVRFPVLLVGGILTIPKSDSYLIGVPTHLKPRLV